MYYFDILSGLARAQIKYLLVGGLAVNLHGVPRVTQDIDIIISLEKPQVERLCETLEDLGYIPRLPVNPMDLANPDIRQAWIQERNLKAFSFYHRKETYRVVDIVLVHPLDFESAFQRKITLDVQEIPIYLLAIDDLITMKQAAGRAQDLSDIDMLRQSLEIDDE